VLVPGHVGCFSIHFNKPGLVLLFYYALFFAVLPLSLFELSVVIVVVFIADFPLLFPSLILTALWGRPPPRLDMESFSRQILITAGMWWRIRHVSGLFDWVVNHEQLDFVWCKTVRHTVPGGSPVRSLCTADRCLCTADYDAQCLNPSGSQSASDR
jgi:hypothetical protein